MKVVDLIKDEKVKDLEKSDKLEYIIADFFRLSDKQIVSMLEDCDSFIYAGGVDQLTVPRKPAGRFFYERNVLTSQRMARLARIAGIKNFLILGAYEAYLAENNKDLRKAGYHKESYVETRLLQEELAFYEAEPNMNVSILRAADIISKEFYEKSKLAVFMGQVRKVNRLLAPKGKIALVSAKALAEASLLALELNRHRQTYALATGSISYQRLYEIICQELSIDRDIEVKSFEELEEFYRNDEIETSKKGMEHGIGQINMLRAASIDFEIKNDLGLGKEEFEEDIIQIIKKLKSL